MPEPTREPSCGPSACPPSALASPRLAVDDDPLAFAKLAADAGFGDGLPLVPPTEERVRGFVAVSGRAPETVLAALPPRGALCTVEKLATNAVMAGAPAEAMALLCASVQALADPALDLFALGATTSCVAPGLFVNGPARRRLRIPCEAGCFGGEAGPGPAIGRALRLVLRNVAGQVVGQTSKSVFGQPARVIGIVVGEWEERSPWPPLAERRGVRGDAVTVHGCTGTQDIADVAAETAEQLLEVIGKSLAYPGTNAFLSGFGAEVMVAIAPPWAERIAAALPDLAAVQARLWDHAALPLEWFPPPHRAWLRERGRVARDGRVPLVERPEDVLVFVCGGFGNLHALGLHSFGPTRAVTRPF